MLCLNPLDFFRGGQLFGKFIYAYENKKVDRKWLYVITNFITQRHVLVVDLDGRYYLEYNKMKDFVPCSALEQFTFCHMQ